MKTAREPSDPTHEAILDAGIRAVLYIRCMDHRTVPQYNTAESSGAECPACHVAELEAELKSAQEQLRLSNIDAANELAAAGDAETEVERLREVANEQLLTGQDERERIRTLETTLAGERAQHASVHAQDVQRIQYLAAALRGAMELRVWASTFGSRTKYMLEWLRGAYCAEVRHAGRFDNPCIQCAETVGLVGRLGTALDLTPPSAEPTGGLGCLRCGSTDVRGANRLCLSCTSDANAVPIEPASTSAEPHVHTALCINRGDWPDCLKPETKEVD